MNSGIKCLLIAVCILGATSPNTLAQSFGPAPINNCDEYAARARAQVEMACPHPNDPRWVRDDVAHRTWCLTASPERRAIEDEARRNGLVQGCRQAASAQDVGNCNEYAWRAEAEIEIASILGQFAPRCKMFGPRWDPDRERIGFGATVSQPRRQLRRKIMHAVLRWQLARFLRIRRHPGRQ